MGFGLPEGQLVKVCGVISASADNLLALHINDNQIRADDDLFDEIIDLFGIKFQTTKPKLPPAQITNDPHSLR